MNTGAIPAFDQIVPNEHPIFGRLGVVFTGTSLPDGDASPWKDVPVGSTYVRTTSSGNTHQSGEWLKVGAQGVDGDWAAKGGFIAAYVSVASFTDGGAAVGTFDLSATIPVGAVVLRTIVQSVKGFAGNVSATLQVGDGTTVNRYMTGTPSVFADADGVDMGVVSGTAYHSAAKTPRLTVTASSDFTLVKTNGAGRLLVKIYYQG